MESDKIMASEPAAVGSEPVEDGGETVVEVEIGGKVEKLTPAQIAAKIKEADERERRAAEKEKGADKAMRESARSRRIMEDWEAAKKWTETGGREGDIEALRRIPTYRELGVTQEQVDQMIQAAKQGGKQRADEDQSEDRGPLTVDDLPPEVQREFRESKKERLSRIRETVHRHLDQVLDNDESLGLVLSSSEVPEGFREEIRLKARSFLARRAETARSTTPDWSPSEADYQSVAREALQWYNRMTGEDGQTGGVTGSKRVPGASQGRAPGPGVPSLHRSKAPLKRPQNNDDGAMGRYLLERANQIMESGEGDNFEIS